MLCVYTVNFIIIFYFYLNLLSIMNQVSLASACMDQ